MKVNKTPRFRPKKLTEADETLYKREFGKALRFFRQKKGLTIGQAAKRFGCRPQRWKQYELGNFINLRVIFHMALAFDSDPNRFSRRLLFLVDKNLKRIQSKK
jgi:transcriptional regulator with XRE-family HTH domain